MNKNLWLLTLCQGLFLTNNVTFIAINGLVGLSLAPLGWMATLPVMGYVVGGVAIQPKGARLSPTNPLIAMNVTLLVKNKPWQATSSQRFAFISADLIQAPGR